MVLSLFLLLLQPMVWQGSTDDPVVLVDRENQAMQDAFEKAKRTLDDFIKLATTYRKDHEKYGAYVKCVLSPG